MSKEQFTSQSNEDHRPAIEIPEYVVKIGAVTLATLGLAGAANTLGLFYSPKSPEKGPSPAHQVAQVVEDYSNGVIMESSRSYQKIQKFALSHLKREKTQLRWPKQPWKNTTRKILKIR